LVSMYDIRGSFDRAGASWASSVNSYGAGIMPGASSGGSGDYLCGYLASGWLKSREMVTDFGRSMSRYGSVSPLTPWAGSAAGVAGSAFAGGMALGFQAPVLAAPMVMPVYVPPTGAAAGGGGGAGGGAGGGTSIHSSDRSSNSPDGAGESSGTTPVTDKDVKAAEKDVKKRGYSETEMKAIVDEAKKASENDKGRFDDIIRALPAKNFDDAKSDVEGEQKKREWTQRFGDWHAKHIAGVKKADDRTQIVRDVAGGGTMTLQLQKGEKDKPVGGVQRYQVAEPSDSEMKEVYYKASDKKWYKDKECKQAIDVPAETSEPGDKPKIRIKGTAPDSLQLTPDGTSQSNTKDGTPVVYDMFKVDGAKGQTANGIMPNIKPGKDGSVRVARDDDGKWYYNDRTKGQIVMIPGNPEYRNGRLYFNRGDNILDTAKSDDAVAYMGSIRTAETECTDRQKKVADADKSQRVTREKKVEGLLQDWLKDRKDDVKFNYDADKNVLTISCPSGQREAVQRQLGVEDGNKDAEKNSKKGQGIMAQLPAGCKVRFADDAAKPEQSRDISSDPFNGMVSELKKKSAAATSSASPASPTAAAKPVVNASVSEPSDFSKLNEKPDRAKAIEKIYNDLNAKIQGARTDNPTANSVTFDGTITLPGESLMDGDWDGIVARLKKDNPGVEIYYRDAKLVDKRGKVTNSSSSLPATRSTDSNAAPASDVKSKNPTPVVPPVTPAAQNAQAERVNKFLAEDPFVKELQAAGATFAFDSNKNPPELNISCPDASKAKVKAIFMRHGAGEGDATISTFNKGIQEAFGKEPAVRSTYNNGFMFVTNDFYVSLRNKFEGKDVASKPNAQPSVAQPKTDTLVVDVAQKPDTTGLAQPPATLKVSNAIDFTGIRQLRALSGDKLENAIVTLLQSAIDEEKKKNNNTSPKEIDLSGSHVIVSRGKLNSAAWEHIKKKLSDANLGAKITRMPTEVSKQTELSDSYDATRTDSSVTIKNFDCRDLTGSDEEIRKRIKNRLDQIVMKEFRKISNLTSVTFEGISLPADAVSSDNFDGITKELSARYDGAVKIGYVDVKGLDSNDQLQWGYSYTSSDTPAAPKSENKDPTPAPAPANAKGADASASKPALAAAATPADVNRKLMEQPIFRELKKHGVTMRYNGETKMLEVTCPPEKAGEAYEAYNSMKADGFNEIFPKDAAGILINGRKANYKNMNYHTELGTQFSTEVPKLMSISDMCDVSDAEAEGGKARRDVVKDQLMQDIEDQQGKQGIVNLQGLVDFKDIVFPQGFSDEDKAYVAQQLTKELKEKYHTNLLVVFPSEYQSQRRREGML